ncbi:dihydroorotase family protein [Beijerinckia sp. L45]|uniref:dihydroorotase n=1 Tax=Beijerinckia sp. L45 TaxID=1641855 RepID=UPI00131CC03B|nr:amidohydrolase family protein [Beijerinckia sp. L45]
MTYDMVLRGAVVTPDTTHLGGWIAVRGETIAAIGTGDAPAAKVVHDFGDAWILPGGIDAQTHAGSYLGLPGLEPTSRAAICGGVTTMIEMPFDHPTPLSTLALFDAKVAAVESLSYCDVALYGTLAPHQATDAMYDLAEAGVCAFKISVCESHPTRFPRIPAEQQLAMLQVAAELGLPLGIHNEDQEIVRFNTERMRATGESSLKVHSSCRPEAAELAATALFLELAAHTGAQAHIVHISTPRGFELLERYKQEGFATTGEICVHYLIFDPDIHGETLGALIKVNPPIRAGARDALWEQIRAGRVECVSSDHSTMSLENKLSGTIFEAGPGVPGIESLMPVLFTGLQAHGMDAPSMMASVMAERPAKLFGLWPKKGAIAVGADADFAVMDPTPFVYDSAKAHDGVNWSPFDGMEMSAAVVATFVRGTQVWDGRTVSGTKGFGRFLPRARTADASAILRARASAA